MAQDYELNRAGDGYSIDKGSEHVEIHPYLVSIRNAGGGLATIDNAGNLRVQNANVAISADQRHLLADYAARAHGIVNLGEQLASDAAGLAANRVGDAFNSLLSGTNDAAAAAARTRAFHREGLALCDQVQALRNSQDRIAQSLAAFRTFTVVSANDVGQCRSRIVSF